MTRAICVDFDGVLHSYDSGWQGPCEIPDPPVEGAFSWLRRMVEYELDGERHFRVCIYSSRSRHEGAIEAMQEWFRKHGLDEQTLGLLHFPTQKPAANMTIDDRAFRFEGEFPSIQWILDFKPWNKR